MNLIAKNLGKRIVELRGKKGLTSEQLAAKIGISKGYLSDIENGKKLPTILMLSKIASALETRLRDFF